MKKKIRLVIFLLIVQIPAVFAQDAKPITYESYYKLKWGYYREFVSLWKQNYYPLLKKLQDKGDITSIIAETPIIHGGEDTRWDFRVLITYKTEHLALDHSITAAYKKLLFPNQEEYGKSEQRRFELVMSHWDVIAEPVPLN